MPKDKVIAYFSKYRNGQNASSHQENGVTLVAKNRDDRKVLVDAGNRCVAPAKSRPKKRKTVKPLQLVNKGGGGSPLQPTEAGSPDVAESVLWSEQVYTVRHLVKQFDGQFPVIARVDDGHYREGVVDLARGQVLLVSGHGKQKRVLARNNSTETQLSLPVDYQMEVIVSSTAELVDFTTAVKEMELPFAATVASVSPLANTSHGNLTGEKLTFLSVKDTAFLRANSISHGWVDQSEILVIPDLVQVQFSVSEGLRDGTEREWHDYQGMFARCVRHLSFSSMTGFQGILLEGPDENELLLASTCCLADADSTTAESQSLQAAKERKKQRIAYENLRLSRLSVTNQNREGLENNLRLNSEDGTNDYDDVLPTHIGQFSASDGIALSETPENGEVLPRSSLDRHPSNVRVVSCSSSTLDYRRPREDRGSKQESVSESTQGAALDAGNDLQRNCSVVSKANSEIIDQLFDEIVDMNKVDQTLVTTASDSEAIGLRNIQPLEDNFRQEEAAVNLESNQAEDDIAGGSSVKNANEQLYGNCRDVLNANSIEMNAEREDLNKKVSTTAEAPPPISKVSVLRCDSKFQSPSQPQTDDASPSGHPLQRLGGKSENKQADTRNDHDKPQKPVGLEKPKPVITDKPKPGQLNRIQPPQRPPSTVGMNQRDKPTVANGAQEELSRQPNRWQQPQKPEKPLHPLIQPPPLSRTPFASKRLPDSSPSCISQIQSISNRKTDDRVWVAPSAVPCSTKPSLPSTPVIPVAQRSSLIREVVIKSSADVPSELESLSVAGVSQCLELLHLDKHTSDFNRNAVDGRKLTDLNEKALENQFHFTPLDASKLVRFVRGWRP